MTVPTNPKLYHILHVDRLSSVVQDSHLWCDREVERLYRGGTSIGMTEIKARRLNQNRLQSHPTLFVGDCVPFYWCPRSVMLFLLHKGNQVQYKGGQGPLLHLVMDLHRAVEWASRENRRWAFTLSNAGAFYFEDSNDLSRLSEIQWGAVEARQWDQCKEGKQAEFLMEFSVPWQLVDEIGVMSASTYGQVVNLISEAEHRPKVEVQPSWYY